MFETYRELSGREADFQLASASLHHSRIPLHDLDEFSLRGGAVPEGAAPGAGGAFALVALERDPEWRLAVGRPLASTPL